MHVVELLVLLYFDNPNLFPKPDYLDADKGSEIIDVERTLEVHRFSLGDIREDDSNRALRPRHNRKRTIHDLPRRALMILFEVLLTTIAPSFCRYADEGT